MRRSGSMRTVCPCMLPFYTAMPDNAPGLPKVQEPTPYDLEEEELAEYAAEYELHLEDINADEFFTYSDIDDSPVGHSAEDDDVEMVM